MGIWKGRYSLIATLETAGLIMLILEVANLITVHLRML